jgi:multidrug efflux pump subunit AcrA (membrane-fusion protein)
MTEASPSIAPASGLDRVTIGCGAGTARPRPQLNPRAIITGVIFLAIIGLAIWYLARSERPLVQGKVESTRIDMAARASGRREKIAVARGQNVAAGATLLVIDNPGPVAERDRGKRRGTVSACVTYSRS